MARRITASLEGKASSAALIGLPEECTLEQLRSLVEARLHVTAEQLYLGRAQVMDAADLRDGDEIRVACAPDGVGLAPCSVLQNESARPPWASVLHALLTLLIFVLLNELFQRFVFKPWFQPATNNDPNLAGQTWARPGRT